MGQYRVLDDIALADCAFEIDGGDLPDLFETAAVALAELMVDPATLRGGVEHGIELRAPALDLLLYDWLAELIYRKDCDREIFPHVRVEVTGQGPFTLRAQVMGGTIDAARTTLGSDPKAVTFHQLRVEELDGSGWRARVVIDI